MRRLLVWAMPWMVVSSAWAQDLRPATIDYTHRESISEGVFRVGDECLISLEAAKKLGWAVRIVEDEADITAEGRRVRVPIRSQYPSTPLPLTPALGQLGAASEWTEDDHLRILGALRSVTFEKGSLIADSTLSFAPSLFKLANPSRLVIDLHGSKLGDGAKFELPASIRIAQYAASVVRIVVEHPSVEDLYLPGVASGRKFELLLGGLDSIDTGSFAPPVVPPVTPLDNTNSAIPQNQQNQTDIIGPPPPPPVVAHLLTITGSGGSVETLWITHSGAISGGPKASYDNPLAIAIEIPGTSLASELPTLPESENIAGISWAVGPKGNAIVTLQLARACGYSVKGSGTKVQIQLLRPRAGNGSLAGKTIVLDAGHGGDDGGAQHASEGVQEKTYTLKVVKQLQAQLQAEGANVVLTRFDDTRISLSERPAIATRAKADLFISVHFNSNKNANSTSGIITFFHGQDPISRLLAECIETELGRMGTLPRIGTWSDTRIYNSGFAVLRNATMPAVLIELGFINHKKDRQLIISPQFHADSAAAIIKGLKVYFANGKS